MTMLVLLQSEMDNFPEFKHGRQGSANKIQIIFCINVVVKNNNEACAASNRTTISISLYT